MPEQVIKYRGRLAPSATGLLHVGHARTFWIAAQRASEHRGTLILRNEDLDPQRCRRELVDAMYEDLRWLSIQWSEGPDCGGPYAPYSQSERREFYVDAWRTLRDTGAIYPCTCSRKDVAQAAAAPNNDVDDEPLYPGTCRQRTDAGPEEEPEHPAEVRRAVQGARHDQGRPAAGEAAAECLERVDGAVVDRVVGLAVVVGDHRRRHREVRAGQATRNDREDDEQRSVVRRAREVSG